MKFWMDFRDLRIFILFEIWFWICFDCRFTSECSYLSDDEKEKEGERGVSKFVSSLYFARFQGYRCYFNRNYKFLSS